MLSHVIILDTQKHTKIYEIRIDDIKTIQRVSYSHPQYTWQYIPPSLHQLDEWLHQLLCREFWTLSWLNEFWTQDLTHSTNLTHLTVQLDFTLETNWSSEFISSSAWVSSTLAAKTWCNSFLFYLLYCHVQYSPEDYLSTGPGNGA